MNLDTTKRKILKIVKSSLALKRVSNQKFKSQWGVVETSYKGDILWVELLNKKVAIVLEERDDLDEYVQESVKELIPFDIIRESIQYKIF